MCPISPAFPLSPKLKGERKAGKRAAYKAAGADDRRGHHSCDGEEVSDALVLDTYWWLLERRPFTVAFGCFLVQWKAASLEALIITRRPVSTGSTKHET